MQTEISPKEHYGRIYKITNKINSKPYIGQTTKEDINDRWNDYKYLNCKSQPKIYNALKKYGPENFLFEVIDTTPLNKFQLDELEKHYVAKFDSWHNGYNCNEGGRGCNHSEETKLKISLSKLGKTLSEEHKRKLSISHIGLKHSDSSKALMSKTRKGINNPMFNKQVSKETRLKLSNANKGNKSYMFGKPKSEETKKKISETLKKKHQLDN